MTTATKKTKLPQFLQGRVFELVTCSIAFIAATIAMLQIPLGANSDSDDVTTVMFAIFIIEALVTAILVRRSGLKMLKTEGDSNLFHRWFFFWLLPPAIFVMQLPWIISGVFNAEDVNTIGAIAMLFFLPWLMVGLGFLALMVFWAPFEMTARGAYRAIVTKGKDTGLLGMGAYLLLWVAIIICGVLGASTERVSYQAHGALLAALLGIPGDYTIKDPTFLWITRGLLVIAIGLPIIFGRRKNEENK